jgi:ribokinase
VSQHSEAHGRTTPSSGPFIVIGDVMVDHIAPLAGPLIVGRDNPTRGTRLLGGQAANTAAWLVSATAQAPALPSVHLVAAVGGDDAGAFIESEMGPAQVRCWFERVAEPTGQCFIAVTPDGDRTMFPDPSANLLLTTGHVERTLEAIANSSESGSRGHVHLSGYLVARVPECASAAMGSAQRHGWSVSMDTPALILNPRQQESLVNLLAGCHIFFANRSELEALAGGPKAPEESPDRLVRTFMERSDFEGIVVVKDGGHGSYATTQQELIHEPATATKVVDTTGAGDAFAAGFLASWCSGDPVSVESPLRLGNATAARAVAQMGAGPLPYSPAVAMRKGR